MENNPPNSSQNPKTEPATPVVPATQTPESQNEKEKIGSLVERLRSYESDIARIKGLNLKPKSETDWNLVPPEVEHKSFEIAGGMGPTVTNPGNTQKTLEASNVMPEPEKPKQDPQEAIDALHREQPIQTSRTIQTDTIDTSKIQETTIADIIRAEEERNRIRPKEVMDPKKSAYILILSGILVVGGLLSVGVFYMIKTAPAPTPATITSPSTIIEIKSSKDLVLAPNQSLKDALINIKNQPAGNSGDILGIMIKEGTSTPVKGPRFARLFSDTMPDWLVRSFKDQNLAGMYSAVGAWQPFMIFKLTSYDVAYAGMLAWEETMQNDFAGLTANSGVDTASSTPFTNPVIKTGFRDVIIKNKDVRVLQDSLGRRLILYSFPDKETLVITTNQAALEAIFAQLTTSKFVQ